MQSEKALGSRVHVNARNRENFFRLTKMERDQKKFIHVTGTENGRHFTFTGDAVILAVPSHNAAAMVEPLDIPLATSLKNIYYPPVAEVYLGFANGDIRRPLDGFGFLIPEKEHRNILGNNLEIRSFSGKSARRPFSVDIVCRRLPATGTRRA